MAQSADAAPGEPNTEKDAITFSDTIGEPESFLQVIPIERGSDSEREPGGAIVVATTPDVIAVADEPQHITPIPEPDRNDMTALRKLGAAVLVRAFEDARTDSRARQWFEVTPQPMLTFWCEVLGLDSERVRKRALTAYAG